MSKNDSKGWIKVDRKIQDHWIWSDEKVNHAQAWIDMLMMANHEEKVISVNGQTKKIRRGQFWTSVRKLSVRWNWSKNRTENFFKILKRENMIFVESRKGIGTLITIVKYDYYQDTNKDTDKDNNKDTDKDNNKDTDKDNNRPCRRTLTDHKQELEELKHYRRAKENSAHTREGLYVYHETEFEE